MTCKPVKAAVWPAKHPEASLDYAVDFEEECARQWSRLTDFAAGERIRLFSGGKAVGFEMEPTTPGRSGLRMPTFPSVEGDSVTDGSIVWTCRALSSASLLRTVVSADWAVDDDDVTIANEAISGFKAVAHLSGGDDEQDYVVTIKVTTSPDGLVIPKTVILPVRVPVKIC